MQKEDSTTIAEGENSKSLPCMAIFNMCTNYMSILQIGNNCEVEVDVVEM